MIDEENFFKYLVDEKKEFVKKNGVPFSTLVYLKGHIMLYIGIKGNEPLVMHNMWSVRLKDETGKISCVLFASHLKALTFTINNGDKIEIRGKVTIYQQNGSYQINVERVRQLGIGELWESYLKLLNKLKEKGLFDTQYKKPIPLFPRAIGVVTSREGSVIKDVITTLKRRMPNIPIIIYHTAVQGSDAVMQIVKAIKTANERLEVDVLIICRGGGSMEDLWSFNEEVVALEVFKSKIPIISAIGHETDTTIIDYVADLRAPTPTGAAELVATSRDTWLTQLNSLKSRLHNNINYIINQYKQTIDIYQSKFQFLNPHNQLLNHKKLIEILKIRLHNVMNLTLMQAKNNLFILKNQLLNNKNKISNLVSYKKDLKALFLRMHNEFINKIQLNAHKLNVLNKQLELLNPHNILARGYAIVHNQSGNIISSKNDTILEDLLQVTLADGELTVRVIENA